MRIVYALTSLGIGGAERQVVALAERMKARGHAVALVTLLGQQAEEWPAAFDLLRLDLRKSPASAIAALLRARRFLRGFRPELIHCHVFPANMAGRLFKLLLPGAVVLSTVHNVYEGGWGRMLAYRLTDFLSCRTIAVSAAAAERYVRLGAIPARKSSVQPNGIDCTEFTPDAERRARLRAQMGVRAEFVWLSAGRITAAKDYPNLLRAFARVLRGFPEARLWIAGEGAGAESARIQAQSAELGAANLGASVRWLGLRRDMAALLDAADGFVLASAWEGMPLVLGEAMAMEKPVVATDVGGVRELAGEEGIIVPAKSPESLAQAMLTTMRRSEGERARAGQAGRKRIASAFSMEAKADQWEALYRANLIK
jgi:glycosyltransferase involved in cell wall biosynthesis